MRLHTGTRLENQALLVSNTFRKVFSITPEAYVGLPGLASDVDTLRTLFRLRTNLNAYREIHPIEPYTLEKLVCSTLYERRSGLYFVEPVVAGLDKDNNPFITSKVLIGNMTLPKDSAVAGTASETMFGVAEGLWDPDLSPDQLFESISQTIMGALERDALLGYDIVVRVMYVFPTELLLVGSIDTSKARRRKSLNGHSSHGKIVLNLKAESNFDRLARLDFLGCTHRRSVGCMVSIKVHLYHRASIQDRGRRCDRDLSNKNGAPFRHT